MSSSYDLRGKVALVTGAARGIGFETSKALIGRGASVVVIDLDEESAQTAASQLSDTKAIGIGADVTDRAAMQRAVATAVEKFGGLDVVVANAGITAHPVTWMTVHFEYHRDWARTEHYLPSVELMKEHGGAYGQFLNYHGALVAPNTAVAAG